MKLQIHFLFLSFISFGYLNLFVSGTSFGVDDIVQSSRSVPRSFSLNLNDAGSSLPEIGAIETFESQIPFHIPAVPDQFVPVDAPLVPDTFNEIPVHASTTPDSLNEVSSDQNDAMTEFMSVYSETPLVKSQDDYTTKDIPETTSDTSDSQESTSEGELCSICRSIIQNDDEPYVKSICGHIFHKNCLNSWLLYSTTCPNCRHELGQQITCIREWFQNIVERSQSIEDEAQTLLQRFKEDYRWTKYLERIQMSLDYLSIARQWLRLHIGYMFDQKLPYNDSRFQQRYRLMFLPEYSLTRCLLTKLARNWIYMEYFVDKYQAVLMKCRDRIAKRTTTLGRARIYYLCRSKLFQKDLRVYDEAVFIFYNSMVAFNQLEKFERMAKPESTTFPLPDWQQHVDIGYSVLSGIVLY